MADLYRKSSIEKLKNPEQLDKAITVSSPASWPVLCGLALIIVAVILWSVFGSLPETKEASGVIVDKSNVCAVYSAKTGKVIEIRKKPGDMVNPRDVIAVAQSADGNIFDIRTNESGAITDLLIKKGARVFSGNEVARLTPDIKSDNVIVCYVPISIGEQLKKDMDVTVYPLSVDSQKYGHMEAKVEQVGEYAVTAANMRYVIGNDNMFDKKFLSRGPVVSVVCKITPDSQSKNGYFWTNKAGNNISLPNGTLISAKIITSNEAPIKKLFKSFGN